MFKPILITLSLIAMLLLPSHLYAQQRLDISMKDASLQQVIKTIESKSQYSFMYSNELDLSRKVSVDRKSATIQEILKDVLAKQNISYEISGNQVLLKAKTTPSDSQQTTTIRGIVADNGNIPLIGVSIVVKGTTNGTITDENGNFELQASIGDVLVISYIGFLAQEIILKDTSISVTLKEDSQYLEEVVVVGYGVQRKKNLTGAVSVIDSKTLSSTPSNDFGSALKGRAAGVHVITPSGKPNAGFSIRVRGTTSINAGNDPLYVVDGIPTNDTKTINPNEIETITVLKDAASAAIYGASGANGVVLITTKQGSKDNAKIELNAYWGFSKLVKDLDVLDAKQYTDLMSDLGYSLDTERYTANTDWQKEIYCTAPMQNYQLSFSGGSQKGSYYASLGYVNQDGIVLSSTFERYNAKVNLDQEVKSWMRVGANVNYSRIEDVDVSDGDSETAILSALNTPPVIETYNPDGSFTGNPFQTGWENPLSNIYGSDRKWVSTRLLGNFYTEISFTKDIKLRNSISVENANDQYDSFIDPFSTNWGRANRGLVNQDKSSYTKWINENIFTYNTVFSKAHSLQLLAGAVFSSHRYQKSSIEMKGFASDKIPSIQAGTLFSYANETIEESANSSFLGRANYMYLNKYMATVNFRADGSSKFGSDNRWGYFPSLSVGWRLSEEAFMDRYDFLDDLKLRAGWGITGNDAINDYLAFARYGVGANYPFNDEIKQGYYQANLGNPNLKWETTEQTNIGVDMSLFTRVNMSLDFYMKKTSDLLLYVKLPLTTAFDDVMKNVGNVENKGVEFLISTRNLTGEFAWNTDFNISMNKNKVTSLGGSPMIFTGALDKKITGTVSVVKEGEPLGSFYGYKAIGVDPEKGDMIYENSEGMYVTGDKLDPDKDRSIIGCAQPDFMYGLNNTFMYKNFELSVFLQGAYGADVYNASRMFMEGMFDSRNQSTAVLNRWTQKGQLTNIPRARQADYSNTEVSTRFIEDGSYLKIKNIRLGYTLPSNITRKALIEKCTVYATIDNVHTFTEYSGYDSELSKDGASSTSIGVDLGTYPYARTFTFGINLIF